VLQGVAGQYRWFVELLGRLRATCSGQPPKPEGERVIGVTCAHVVPVAYRLTLAFRIVVNVLDEVRCSTAHRAGNCFQQVGIVVGGPYRAAIRRGYDPRPVERIAGAAGANGLVSDAPIHRRSVPVVVE